MQYGFGVAVILLCVAVMALVAACCLFTERERAQKKAKERAERRARIVAELVGQENGENCELSAGAEIERQIEKCLVGNYRNSGEIPAGKTGAPLEGELVKYITGNSGKSPALTDEAVPEPGIRQKGTFAPEPAIPLEPVAKKHAEPAAKTTGEATAEKSAGPAGGTAVSKAADTTASKAADTAASKAADTAVSRAADTAASRVYDTAASGASGAIPGGEYSRLRELVRGRLSGRGAEQQAEELRRELYERTVRAERAGRDIAVGSGIFIPAAVLYVPARNLLLPPAAQPYAGIVGLAALLLYAVFLIRRGRARTENVKMICVITEIMAETGAPPEISDEDAA